MSRRSDRLKQQSADERAWARQQRERPNEPPKYLPHKWDSTPAYPCVSSRHDFTMNGPYCWYCGKINPERKA